MADYRLAARNAYLDPFGSGLTSVNRDYVRSSSKWVKIWVSWTDMQNPTASRIPRNRDQSWAQLNDTQLQRDPDPNVKPTTKGPQAEFVRLDRQIAAANADGVAVIPGLYQSYPSFSHEGNNIPPPRISDIYPDKVYGDDAQVPDSLSPDGPWGWFIDYLISRYKRGVPANTPGPQAGNQFGNPSSAFVHALEIVNEPNITMYPQAGLPSKVADMMKSSSTLAARAGWPATGQFLLAPGLSDYNPESNNLSTTVNGVVVRTRYNEFAEAVLGLVRGASFPTYVGWSQHNYYDIKYPFASTATPNSRAQRIQQLLGTTAYPGGIYQGLNNLVWLTEGGYQKEFLTTNGLVEDYDRQRPKCDANYSRMLNTPGIYMWSQYIVFNRADEDEVTGEFVDTFLSGVGDGYYSEPPRPNGATFEVNLQSDDGTTYGSGRAYGWWTSWQRKTGSTTP